MYAIVAFFTRLVLKHYYGWWSRLYRRIWEGAFDIDSKAHLDLVLHAHTFETLHDVAMYLKEKAVLWRSDGWRQLFDAVSYPARADALFAGRIGDLHGLDCDEFAVWASFLVNMRRHVWGVEGAWMLTVTWMGDTVGSLNGHNVCGIEWADGTFSYMDYGSPSQRVASWEAVVEQVREKYAEGGRLLAWGRYEPFGMARIEVH